MNSIREILFASERSVNLGQLGRNLALARAFKRNGDRVVPAVTDVRVARAFLYAALAENVQRLTGTGSAALTLTGNALADVVRANSDVDMLDTCSGVATLVGGGGNDTTVINNAFDMIPKAANTGISTGQGSASASVTLASTVQNLTAIGTSALTLAGNTLNSCISGNSGNDTLMVGDETEKLIGNAGGSDTVSVGVVHGAAGRCQQHHRVDRVCRERQIAPGWKRHAPHRLGIGYRPCHARQRRRHCHDHGWHRHADVRHGPVHAVKRGRDRKRGAGQKRADQLVHHKGKAEPADLQRRARDYCGRHRSTCPGDGAVRRTCSWGSTCTAGSKRRWCRNWRPTGADALTAPPLAI